MNVHSRPSLDLLVPLVMLENTTTNNNIDTLSNESETEVLRHFESGDIVLVQLESQCLPAIVFNITGLVMKFDIDRQLYHVCLLDKNFTEKWVNATDMIIYSVPMIVECENEQIMLMWSTANELLGIRNHNDDKVRLEEFKKRFTEAKYQQLTFLSVNNNTSSNKNRKSRTSIQKISQQIFVYSPLTMYEELHIIDSIYRLPRCTYAEAKHIAEEIYMKIVCTNNRENIQSYSIENIPNQWFLTFVIRQIDYLRRYSTIWIKELEAMTNTIENKNELYSLISLMKKSV